MSTASRMAAGIVAAICLTAVTAEVRQSKFTPAVAGQPEIQQALAYIDQKFDDQVNEWVKLTEISAQSTHEEKRAAYLRAEVAKLGLQATTDAMGNVMVRRAGTGGGPAVVIAAHMDTVHPMDTDVRVRRFSDGTLHAPGVFDDTSSVVNVLQMLRALEAASVKTKGDLVILFTVQEELGLKGMYHWFERNPRVADMIVAVDSDLGAVNYGALGIYWSRMKFTAPGAHTLNSRGQPHPARAAAECINDIYTIPLPASDAPVTAIYNVGMLGGGTIVNAIAPEVWFTVDVRTVDRDLLKKLDTEIAAKCEAAARAQRVTFTRDYLQKSEAGGRPEELADRLSHPVVQTAVDVLTYLGVAIVPNGVPVATGSTDANVGVLNGVPSVAVGRSRGGNQHSLSEWADIATAKVGTKQILLLAVSLAELSGS